MPSIYSIGCPNASYWSGAPPSCSGSSSASTPPTRRETRRPCRSSCAPGWTRRAFECRAAHGGRGTPEPGGPAGRRLGRPAAVPARPRGHRPRGSERVERRSLVGRSDRRVRLGSRRHRHEGPGGVRGHRGAGAGRGGLAAGGGRAAAGVHQRRGDRRRPRRALAVRAASGAGPLRHGGQRGRRRGDRVRRPPGLRRVRGREGGVPLHASPPRAAPATPRCRASGTTRW